MKFYFYTPGDSVKKLIDTNFDISKFSKDRQYLEGISLGINFVDMSLLMERLAYYYFKQGKNINHIFLELGDFNDLTPFEEKLFAILTNDASNYQLKKHFLCTYQTCKRAPIKILFSDKDGTIFGRGITYEQVVKNLLALQEFTNQGKYYSYYN